MTKDTEEFLFNVAFIVFFIPGLIYGALHIEQWSRAAHRVIPWQLFAWLSVGFLLYLVADWNKSKRIRGV